MATPILATKLYIPPHRPKIILRHRLIERLNEGLSVSRKLTLISASAGFVTGRPSSPPRSAEAE